MTAYVVIWAVVIVCALEFWAAMMLRRGPAILEEHQVKTAIRKVSEAFHTDLWAIPWKVYKPNATVSVVDDGTTYSTTINGIGLRGPELVRTRGARIVVCLGGSTTVNGPSNDATYPALLEGILNESSPRRVVVVNGGVSARLSEDYIHHLRQLMTTAWPDMVVEYNGANDLCVKLIPQWKGRIGLVRRLLAKSRFVSYMFEEQLLPDEKQMRSDIRKYTIAHLKQSAELLTGQGIKFAVCSFLRPELTSESESWKKSYLDHDLRLSWRTGYVTYRSYRRMVDLYNDELRKAFADGEVRYLPLAETLQLRSHEFIDICHLTPVAIEKKARAIAALIAADPQLAASDVSATKNAEGQ